MIKFIEEMIHELQGVVNSNPGKEIIILLGWEERKKLEEWNNRGIKRNFFSSIYEPGTSEFYGHMVVFTHHAECQRYVVDISL